MYPDNEKLTSFRTPMGDCHALRTEEHGGNISESYDEIFHEHMLKIVECYVNDIAVKSRTKGNHIADLKTVFKIMRVHQLKMNPTKSFLGVTSGKFLGFVVISKGIHLDSEKVHAVQGMQPPRNLRELRGLQG